MSKVTTSNTNVTTVACTNDSSAAFMNQLEYISKCRSVSSDGISSNPPSSKRSRLVYNSQQQQELQQREQRRHRELQQQRAQYQQESLRKQEAAVVLAQQQQREHFIHSMRARQHQERQAALSTLAAANLAAYRHQPSQQLTRYTSQGGASCCWPTYGVAGGQTQATTLQTNSSRHQLQQMSSFQQITPPGSMPFCWAPGPAPPTHHTSACPPSCCPSLTATVGCRSAGCSTLFQSGRHPGSYRHQEKASYGMDLVRSKQAATMAAMASCYGGNQRSNLVPPPMACAATPALTGGNPNTVAAAAAAAAMVGAPYCLGCVQGKCQVTWNKENAVNNGIMRSL